MFLICFIQFVLAGNEDKIKIGIVLQQEHQTGNGGQFEKRVKQSFSKYPSAEIHTVQIETEHQLNELFQSLSNQRILDYIFVPCDNSKNQLVDDECTFYRYDVKNSAEASYTFSLINTNPKSVVSFLDQKYIKPIFTESNPWTSRILIFGSIIGAFYLAQTWIEVEFGGGGSNGIAQGTGSH